MARDGFDFIGNLSDIGRACAKETRRGFKELGEGLGADVDRVIHKIETEGLVQGAVEAFDTCSVGNLTAETADAFNLIPEDPGLKELISGAVNFAAGGPGQLLAIKDAFDAVAACTTPDPGAVAQRPTAPQTPESPEAAKRARIDAAKEEARRRAQEKVAAAQARARDGYCDCGSVMDGAHRTTKDLMKTVEELFGKSTTDEADAEIAKLLKALKNKDLCFEDRIFLLMRAVIKQSQKEVDAMGDQLVAMGDANRAKRGELNDAIAAKMGELSGAKDPTAANRIQVDLESLRGQRENTLEKRMESRQELAEQLKNAMQKLSEMQQALSNVLNTQHESAMSAIRNIR